MPMVREIYYFYMLLLLLLLLLLFLHAIIIIIIIIIINIQNIQIFDWKHLLIVTAWSMIAINTTDATDDCKSDISVVDIDNYNRQ